MHSLGQGISSPHRESLLPRAGNHAANLSQALAQARRSLESLWGLQDPQGDRGSLSHHHAQGPYGTLKFNLANAVER